MTSSKPQIDKKLELEKVFGEVTIKQHGPSSFSASVPAFAEYGQQNFQMSLSGSSPDEAVTRLFEQVAHSAGRATEFETDAPGRPRVFRSKDRAEVIYYTTPFVAENRGFKVLRPMSLANCIEAKIF